MRHLYNDNQVTTKEHKQQLHKLTTNIHKTKRNDSKAFHSIQTRNRSVYCTARGNLNNSAALLFVINALTNAIDITVNWLL